MLIRNVLFQGFSLRLLCIGVVLFFVALLLPLPSKAGINQGINYLLNSQNTDGSWGSDPSLVYLETTEAIRALALFGQKVDIYKRGVQYLRNRLAVRTNLLCSDVGTSRLCPKGHLCHLYASGTSF